MRHCISKAFCVFLIGGSAAVFLSQNGTAQERSIRPIEGVTFAVWPNFGMCVPRSIYTPEGDTARVEYFRKLRRAGFNNVYYFPNVIWGDYEYGIRTKAGWKTEEFTVAVGPGDASGKSFSEYIAYLDDFISKHRIKALYFDEPSDQRDRWNVEELDAPLVSTGERRMTRLEQIINIVTKYPKHVGEVIVNGYASGAGDPNNPATVDPVNAMHYGFPYPVHHFEYEQLTGLWPDGFTGSPFKALYESGFPVRIMDDTYHYPPQYGLPGVGDQTPLWHMEADNTRAAGATIGFSATRGDAWDPLRYPFPSDYQSFPMLFGRFLEIHNLYNNDPAHDFSALSVYCGDMDADMVNRMRRFMVAWHVERTRKGNRDTGYQRLSSDNEPRCHPCDAFAVYTNPDIPSNAEVSAWDVYALCAANPRALASNITRMLDGDGAGNDGYIRIWLDERYPLLPMNDPGYADRLRERDSLTATIHADFRENTRPQMSEFFYADMAGWLIYYSGELGAFVREYMCAYHDLLLEIVTQAGLAAGLLEEHVVGISTPHSSPNPGTIMLRAYPNPVTAGEQVSVEYTTNATASVSLTLYNTLGIEVYSAQPGRQSPGEHTLTIPTRGLAPGVYQCVLQSGGERAVQIMVVR